MAVDNRSITITLKLTGEDSTPANSSSASEQTSTESFTGNSKDNTKAAAFALAGQALSVAVNETIAWAEYYWNRELTLDDDYIGQRNKQIALTQINRGVGYASQIFSATASGAAVGGGIGAVIGLAIGLTSVAANIARSNQQGRLDQDIMLKQMDAQLGFTRSRAGWSTKAASIGENL